MEQNPLNSEMRMQLLRFAPARSLAMAPVVLKLVGAPLRKNQTNAMKGTSANNGMQVRHVIQFVPKTILPQAMGLWNPIAMPPAAGITRKGRKVGANTFPPR